MLPAHEKNEISLSLFTVFAVRSLTIVVNDTLGRLVQTPKDATGTAWIGS